MQSEPNYIEKVVERIVMLPQIVEVVKHFHQIEEVQSLGIAVNTDIHEHTEKYLSISTNLRVSLKETL